MMAPRGRPPSAKTLVDRQLGRTSQNPIIPAGESFIIPNHSGDHSAGNVTKTPVKPTDIVNKEYVDNLPINTGIDLYVSSDASTGLSGYYQLSGEVQDGPEDSFTIEVTGNAQDQFVGGAATETDESLITAIGKLTAGTYEAHIHVKAATANRISVYFKVYIRDSLGNETLIGTSLESDKIGTDEEEVTLHFLVNQEYDLESTNWIITRLYANNSSPVATDLTGYLEGDTAARITLEGLATLAPAIPTGIITMWSGSTATIPSGWVICDGTNSTPDLRDKFVIGAGSTYAVDATGGDTTHNHTGNTGYTGGGTLAGPGTAKIGTQSHRHTISSVNHLPPYYALAFIMKT